MYDSGHKILIGIILFVAFMTFPFWYNLGKAAPAPELEKPKEAKQCVEATPFMRTTHMQLLDQWRNSVVRNANRVYFNFQGQRFDMSLQNTCIGCHTSKVKFCDRCHNYAGVSPFCWECHIEPQENG